VRQASRGEEKKKERRPEKGENNDRKKAKAHEKESEGKA